MAAVKWIKITTDIFDDEKILLIENLPDGDTILVIWLKLLCLAGKQNNGGVFVMNNKMPYTEEMLSTIFRRPMNTIRLALITFQEYGMIELIDDVITIPNWEKHQNIEGLEKIREQTKARVSRHREKQKLIRLEEDLNSNVTVTQCNATEKNRIEEDKKRIDKNREEKNDYQHIADMYNEICISFPRLKILSDSRKKALKARLKTYSEDDFRRMFEMAEASDFLKGKNSKDWNATFDWMIKDANMAKILDGNYNGSSSGSSFSSKNQTKAEELNDFYNIAANWAEEGESNE